MKCEFNEIFNEKIHGVTCTKSLSPCLDAMSKIRCLNWSLQLETAGIAACNYKQTKGSLKLSPLLGQRPMDLSLRIHKRFHHLILFSQITT